MQHAHDVKTDVESDEVCECQRAHRMRHAQLEHFVHSCRRCHPFHHRKHGFVQKRHEHAVGYEPGRVVYLDRCLLQLEGELFDHFKGFVGCGQTAHDFDQLHDRNWIEKVHTDDYIGP